MITTIFKALVCFLAASSLLVEARLQVKRPDTFKSQFDNYNGLDYYVVTPQDSPKKKNLIGNLVLSDPITGCTTELLSNEVLIVPNPIIVVRKGECAYPQKAKNAELSGAKMVIIVSDQDLPPNHAVEREYSKCNPEYPVGIETIIMSKTDGEKIISYLEKARGDPDHYPPLPEVTYSTDIEKSINYQQKTENVVIDYWFVSSDLDGDSYSLLAELHDIVSEFRDRVIFKPHYVTWQCEICKLSEFSKADPRCVSGGRYCDPEPLGVTNIAGAASLLENVRQICLRNYYEMVNSQEMWWRYAIRFSELCAKSSAVSVNDCRQMVYDEIGIYPEARERIEDCIRDSFEGSQTGYGTDLIAVNEDNFLLRNELDLQNQILLPHYPNLYANGGRYTDSFYNRELIKNFICSRFNNQNQPETCKRTVLYSMNPQQNSSETFFVSVLVVLTSCIIMVTLIYCVRRSVKRQMMQRMDAEISSIITQYTRMRENATVETSI